MVNADFFFIRISFIPIFDIEMSAFFKTAESEIHCYFK